MSRLLLANLTFAGALVLAAAQSARAELIYGVAHTGGQNTLNELFTFDSATPGTVNVLGNITGLGNLQYLDDIDFRPSTGELYGQGYTGSVYKIDINTLVATSVGFVPAPGSGFSGAGIDFDSVTTYLRIIDGQSLLNFSFNPDNGTHTLDSPAVQYAAGDPNFGADPRVSGIAYNNNVSGALTTTLYGLDIHGPVMPPATVLDIVTPATGDLHTVGSTGVSTGDNGGFDISGTTGNAYAVYRTFAPSAANFYTINTTTGLATFVGEVGIDSTNFIMAGLSAAPAVVPPGGGGNNAPLPPAILIAPIGAALATFTARRFRRNVQ